MSGVYGSLSMLVLFIAGVGGAMWWGVRAQTQAHLQLAGMDADVPEFDVNELERVCLMRTYGLMALVPIAVIGSALLGIQFVAESDLHSAESAREARWASDSNEYVSEDVPFTIRGTFDDWLSDPSNQAHVERWFGSVQGYLRRQRELQEKYGEVTGASLIHDTFFLNYDRPGRVETMEARGGGSIAGYVRHQCERVMLGRRGGQSAPCSERVPPPDDPRWP